MAELVKVVVDAMGGDNAPEEPVKAAVEAVNHATLPQAVGTESFKTFHRKLIGWQTFLLRQYVDGHLAGQDKIGTDSCGDNQNKAEDPAPVIGEPIRQEIIPFSFELKGFGYRVYIL